MAEPSPQDPSPQDGAPPSSAEALASDALSAAERAVADLGQAAGESSTPDPSRASGGAGAPAPFPLKDLGAVPAAQPLPAGIDLLSDVVLHVKIELGRTRMLVEDVLKLGEGAVVELDKLAGDPVDVYVNDRPVARGEVLVLNDSFCVRINEILDPGAEPARAAG